MLTRWDPFREMVSLREAMDSLFENALTSPWGGAQQQGASFGLPLDVTENQDAFVIKASVPGVNPEDLDVSVHGDTLTIKGETKADEQKQDERYHLRERRYGKFSRTLNFPVELDGAKAEASVENGVLTVRVPKAETAKPKMITVRAK